MKKQIIFGLLGVLIGILLTGIIMWNSAAGIMLIEDESRYDFDEAVNVFKNTVHENGWKIPILHDLQETMNKYGYDVGRVVVFELCHPDHAYRILSQDQERVVSSLMPCRVAIYERSDGKVYVSRMNSGLMGKMMKGVVPEVMGIAAFETEEIIKSIIK